MKFQNCILINFVMDAQTDVWTHTQVESNMPPQLFQNWGHNKTYTIVKGRDTAATQSHSSAVVKPNMFLKRLSLGSKECTKELKPECANFLGQTS